MGEDQQLGDVLLVTALFHHEHQSPVAGLGVAAGQGEVGLLGWKADPFVSSP